jgi:hypothetical protein
VIEINDRPDPIPRAPGVIDGGALGRPIGGEVARIWGRVGSRLRANRHFEKAGLVPIRKAVRIQQVETTLDAERTRHSGIIGGKHAGGVLDSIVISRTTRETIESIEGTANRHTVSGVVMIPGNRIADGEPGTVFHSQPREKQARQLDDHEDHQQHHRQN